MSKPLKEEIDLANEMYINLVPDAEEGLATLLKKNTIEILKFFNNINPEVYDYCYEDGKWSVKEIFMHLIDTDRGLSYRSFVCVRGDNIPLYPLNENICAENADVSKRTMESLLSEFQVVRAGFEMVFDYATEDQLSVSGNSINGTNTARAFGYMSIGHTLHHVRVIKEKYIKNFEY